MRQETIRKIDEKKVIAIIRGIYGEDCINLAQALYNGGIELIEVTFDQAHCETFQDTQKAIAGINSRFAGKVLAGAGTVTSVELVRLAAEAGAKYIISPDTDPDVIRHTLQMDMVSIPGAMTATEVLCAHKAGADYVKLFPASVLGTEYIKAIRAPLNHVKLLVVGGVNEKNVKEFMKADASGAGVGGNLVNKKWIAEGNFEAITALAREFAQAVNNV